jgi:hypothetical protein
MKKHFLIFSVLLLSFMHLHAQWTNGGTQISTTADNHHRAFTSAAPNGSYYVCWQATDTTASALSKIRVAHYDSTGSLMPGWTAGGKLTSPAGDHYAPQLITTEDGGVIVTWYGYALGNPRSYIYAQKYNASGAALWNFTNPLMVSTGTIYNHKYPIITNDKHSGAYITWVRYDSTNSASSPDIFLQHIDSIGQVAFGWNLSPVGVAVNAGQREYDPRLALTPDKNSVYVTYAQGLIGNTFLTLKKYDALNGNLSTGWSTNGVTLSPGPNVYPDINHDLWVYADNANNAVVFWVESRSSANGEIYMQQVSPAASPLLAANGILIGGNTSNGIDYLEVQQESDMDFLLAYNNLETFNDVETEKVKGNGTILWHDLANTTGGYSAYPMPVSDGNKGMFVFYKGTGSPDRLFALGVDSLGHLNTGVSWALPGPGFGVVSNNDPFEPNYDLNPIATKKGEAVVSWNRTVAGLFQVFTCDLLRNGNTCTNYPAGVEELSMQKGPILIYPNPFSDELILRILPESHLENANPLLRIYTLDGRLVQEERLHVLTETHISTAQIARGMYFYQVVDGEKIVQNGKIIRN